MKKQLGLVLALILCGALSVGVAPKASAAGTIYNINNQSQWATVANAYSEIWLYDGDTLNIAAAAASPTSPTTIFIASNANVTINGNGVMRTGVWIREYGENTVLHTVTINNLQITAPAGYWAYLQYDGTINLVGTNVFVGPPDLYALSGNGWSLTDHQVSITSSTGGSLEVRSANTQGLQSLWAKDLRIQGNARVTVTASGNGPAVTAGAVEIDSGASLTATSSGSNAIIGDYLVMKNYGTLTVSGGMWYTALSSNNSNVWIQMGEHAVTSITTLKSEVDAYSMLVASGYKWAISGGSLVAPGTVDSLWTSIAVSGGSTLVVKLVPGAPPTTPVLPMIQFTESPDMTGDGLGDTLAVDTGGHLWVFPGSPSGQFGSPVSRLASAFAFLEIAAPGDIDGDGRADVLAIDSPGNLLLYPGNGAKALSTPRQVGNGWQGWRLIPAGDLTGDGKPDLLGIDSAGDLYMYAGKGNGLFAMKVKVGNGWNGWQLYAAGDLNGDGRTDILGIDGSGNLFQYAGKGNGTFATKVQAGNGWTGYTLAAGADLNGDGLADIIGRDDSSHVLYFYRGMGSAKFATKKQIATGW